MKNITWSFIAGIAFGGAAKLLADSIAEGNVWKIVLNSLLALFLLSYAFLPLNEK
jgi:hypothetical protein